MAAGGAAAAAAAAAAQYNAIKASGAIVEVEPQTLLDILNKGEKPLVVAAYGGFIVKRYSYLTPYRGLIFAAKSATPLHLPSKAEIIAAGKIWVPST
ncbi:MAG TPA: hypothetical protein VFI42_09555 [Thermomicrobiaceae bacterium]|nr:hypothetical protein [Thermomicrobiaceae bacterium]